MISAVLPIMSLYKLPHGQYAYSGHIIIIIINLPQDVALFANSLPRLPCELDIFIVRKGASNSHRHFRVRRAVVLRAYQWLVANNKYYHINPEALAMLPKDGDLSGLHSVSLDSMEDDTGLSETQHEDEDPYYDTHLSGSFVPSTTQRMTARDS